MRILGLTCLAFGLPIFAQPAVANQPAAAQAPAHSSPTETTHAIAEVFVKVDKEGKLSQVRVVHSAGKGSEFDRKAIEAVSQYKFKPTIRNGRAVSVEMYINVNFDIKSSGPHPAPSATPASPESHHPPTPTTAATSTPPAA